MLSRTKKILRVAAILVFLAGVGVLLYPYICQIRYRQEADKIIDAYEQRIENPEAGEDWEWLYRLIQEYNRDLYETNQSNLVDPFSYEQVDFSLKEFGFEEDMIGYISVPVMDVRLPVYLGASKENMERGAAHLTQTSIPIGGENTNAVIAAHRGLGTAAMFRQIEKIDIGDDVYFTNFRETLHYKAAEIKIIWPDDFYEVLIQPERDLVTLITCHPYRKNTHRYVVYCERVA